jgi:predicted ribosomally synthesized peptide with nif11-like leader
MEEKIKQLQAKLEADQSLGEKLFTLETPEEVQDFLKEQGLDFSLAEINEIRDALVKLAEKAQASPDGELSDADLEDVAGGAGGLILLTLVTTSFIAGFVADAVERRW